MVRGRLDAEGIRSELEGEAVAGWFWHFGSALGGVRLLVSENDVDRAAAALGGDLSIDETQDIDFGDDSDDDVDEGEAAQLPEDLLRAWRASLIGFLLLPPLLSLYSTWLLIRNGLFIGRCRNWRVAATCAANGVVFTLVILIVLLIANPSHSPPEYATPAGDPIHVKHQTENIKIPLLP